MKQRIIATILLLVTVLATFAGCANYAFAEKASFADYATVDYDALLKALHTIEIDEEDFGPEEDRQAIVVDEIYNTLLTALYKNADNKQKTGFISSVRDVVEYYYYCTYTVGDVVYKYNYTMTTTANTTTTTSSTDAEKDLKKAIVEAVLNAENPYEFSEENAYSIKSTLSNEKLTEDDVIVVSYTLKTTVGGVVTYKDYAYHTIDKNHELFDAIITNSTDAVVLGTYKSNEAVVVGENTYKNISISHIVENAGKSIVVPQTTEDEQDVTAYVNGVKTTVTIPEDATVNYHVYPVSYVSAPVVDADLIVRYVLGDDITTTSLDVLGSEEYTVVVGEETLTVKALVEQLAAEYKKGADQYEGGAVEIAKGVLAEERKLAKAESIKDAIDALSKATKTVDGATKKVTDAILEHYNSKNEDNQAADIYAVFESLSANGKVKFADLLPGGILTLYTYKNSSDVSAVSLVNDINAEYENDVNTAYDSYQKDTDSTKAGNEIDVVDKKEKNIGELLSKVMPQDLIKFGLIPEFIGRVPVVQSLEQLDEEALVRILTEPKNALVKQYQRLLDLDGVQLKFTEDAVRLIAKEALERKTGARGLRAIIEKAMTNIMYEVPSDDTIGTCTVTEDVIAGKGEPILTYRDEVVTETRQSNRRRALRTKNNDIA